MAVLLSLFYFGIRKKNRGCPPENNLLKKNKKGLASVILATNSPISNW